VNTIKLIRLFDHNEVILNVTSFLLTGSILLVKIIRDIAFMIEFVDRASFSDVTTSFVR
jgi:hypothetical protein